MTSVAEPAVNATAAPSGRRVPLTGAQETVRLLTELTGGSSAYHTYAGLRLAGPLDVDALRAAVSAVVARHDALRAALDPADPDTQLVQPAVPVELTTTDVTGEADPPRRALAEAAQEVRRPFRLDHAPLWRVRLWRTGPDEHYLLWCAHQLVCDAWSLRTVLADLAAGYATARRGRPQQPPAAPGYAAAVEAERAALAEPGRRDQLAAYWRDRLAGVNTAEIPPDLARPPRPTFRGATLRRPLPDNLDEAVAAFARAEGCAPAAVLVAAVATLIARYAGREQVVVGVPDPGRPQSEAPALVGCFGGTLPVPVDLAGEPSFRELVHRTAGHLERDRAHAVLPFPRIVEAARIDHDPSRPPLFAVSAELVDGQPPELPGLRVTPEDPEAAAAVLDLALTARTGRHGGEVSAVYNADLYSPATVHRVLMHLGDLLRQAVAAPDRRVTDLLPRLAGDEVVLAHRWDAAAEPPARTIPELFRAQAARTPAAPALECGGERLTYAELDRLSDRLAWALRERGAGPDRPVAFCLPRTTDLPATVLAILKAGGAYLPLDPSLPAERIGYMLADARPAAVVVDPPVADRLPAVDAPVLTTAELRAAARRQPDGPPPLDAGPENLMYVLYTSGSTGRPKGVAMPHRGLVNLAQWQLRAPRGTRKGAGRALQFHTIGFDIASQELFATWAAGDTVVMVGDGERTDPERLLRVIRDREITTLYLPCAALVELAHAAQLSGVVPERLRDVYQCGEQLKVTDAMRWFFAALPDCRLHNQYGPTEAGPICTHHTLTGAPASWPELPPIGRPMDHTRCYVLDGRRRPVPAGGVGVLHVGGAQVARGYVNRDELTRERFVEVAVDGWRERVYDTGDLVRVDPDGDLHYLGRGDTQVKVRGYRVELGEIETALADHPAVAAAVVALRQVGAAPALVAYWTPAVAGEPATGAPDLAGYLAERLPPYMVPARYLRMDGFPRTPSGKIDRKALPEPGQPEGGDGVAGDPPATPFEEVAAEVLARRLGVSPVRRDDRFFELGGHSLTALGVVAELREACGVRLPASVLLGNATVADIGAEIERLVLENLRTPELEDLLTTVEEAHDD